MSGVNPRVAAGNFNRLPLLGYDENHDAFANHSFVVAKVSFTGNTDASGYITVTHKPIIARRRLLDGSENLDVAQDITAVDSVGTTLYVGTVQAKTGVIRLYTDAEKTTVAASKNNCVITYWYPAPMKGTVQSDGTFVPDMQVTGSIAGYVIPMMDITAWSGFTNQPANDGVEVVSNNAGDTGKCTIFGTTHVGGAFAYETITLNGVTAVATTKVDWGNVYGIFLGDIEGKNITPAVGTITVREASADQTITTLAANAISKGMTAFNLTGKNIILNVHSGNVWKRCAGVVTAANGFKMNLTGGNIKEERIASMIYLISDTTGATAQIEVMA